MVRVPASTESQILQVTLADGPHAGDSVVGVMVPWIPNRDVVEVLETTRLGICLLPERTVLKGQGLLVERFKSPAGASRVRRPAEILGTDDQTGVVVFRFEESLTRAMDAVSILSDPKKLDDEAVLQLISLGGIATDDDEAFSIQVFETSYRNLSANSETGDTGVALVLGLERGEIYGFVDPANPNCPLTGAASLKSSVRLSESVSLEAPESVYGYIDPAKMAFHLIDSTRLQSLFPEANASLKTFVIPNAGAKNAGEVITKINSQETLEAHLVSLPASESKLAEVMDGESRSIAVVIGTGDSVVEMVNPCVIHGWKLGGNIWKFSAENAAWKQELTEDWAELKKLTSRPPGEIAPSSTRPGSFDLTGTRRPYRPASRSQPESPPPAEETPKAPAKTEGSQSYPVLPASNVELDQPALEMTLLRSGREFLVRHEEAPFYRRFNTGDGKELPLPVDLNRTDRLCGSAESIFRLRKATRELERFDAENLEKKAGQVLPLDVIPIDVVIGWSSRHAPLVAATSGGFLIFDPETLKPRELINRIQAQDLDRYAEYRTVSSANGQAIALLGENGSTNKTVQVKFPGYEQWKLRGMDGFGLLGHSPFIRSERAEYQYLSLSDSRYNTRETETFKWKAPVGGFPNLIPATGAPVGLLVYPATSKTDLHAEFISLVESGSPAPLSEKFALPEYEDGNTKNFRNKIVLALPFPHLISLSQNDRKLTLRKIAFTSRKDGESPEFLSFPEDSILRPGREFSYGPKLRLSPEDKPKFSMRPELAGAEFDTVTGRLNWKPDRSFPADSVWVTLECETADGERSGQSFLISIDAEPVARLFGNDEAVAEQAIRKSANNGKGERKPDAIPSGTGFRPRFYFSEVPIESLILIPQPGNLAVIRDGNDRVSVIDTDTVETLASKPLQDPDAFLAGGVDALFVFSPSVRTLYRFRLPTLDIEASYVLPKDWSLKLLGAPKGSAEGPIFLVMQRIHRENLENYLVASHLALHARTLAPITQPEIAPPPQSGPAGPFIQGLPHNDVRELGVSRDGTVAILPDYFLVYTNRITTTVPRDGQSTFYFHSGEPVFHPSATMAYHNFGFDIGGVERDPPASLDSTDPSEMAMVSKGNVLAVIGAYDQHEDSTVGFFTVPDGRALGGLFDLKGPEIDAVIPRTVDSGSFPERYLRSDFSSGRLAFFKTDERRLVSFWKIHPTDHFGKTDIDLVVTSSAPILCASGLPWEYQVTVSSPEAVASYALQAPPAEMEIDEASGLITFKPDAARSNEALTVTVEIKSKSGHVIIHEFVTLIIGRAAMPKGERVAAAGN